jgi:DNA-binding FadR family transcriptional regulator
VIAENQARSGYSAWRLIAEELRVDITSGRFPVGGRLPTEAELAERFGVNRHTVRRGVAALAAEGLVEARRGSGRGGAGRRSLDATPEGDPLHVGLTRFPAHLVELDVAHQPR